MGIFNRKVKGDKTRYTLDVSKNLHSYTDCQDIKGKIKFVGREKILKYKLCSRCSERQSEETHKIAIDMDKNFKNNVGEFINNINKAGLVGDEKKRTFEAGLLYMVLMRRFYGMLDSLNNKLDSKALGGKG